MRKINMRRFLFLMIMVLLSNICFAQFAFTKSVGQQYAETVTKSGLFISKQSFRISNKKSGKVYGYNGKSYFGIQYSVGIKVKDGIILTDKVVRPWEYDNNFSQYKEEYDPILYKSEFSGIEDKITFDTLSYNVGETAVLVEDEAYMFSSSTFSGEGFSIDNTKGEKEGWVVWVMSDEDAEISQSSNIYLTAYSKAVNVSSKSEPIDLDTPKTNDKILGGLYIVPYFTEIGVIEFKVSGILIGNDSKWRIYTPFIGMDIVTNSIKSGSETPLSVSEEDKQSPSGLTPVNDKSSKRKRMK